MNDSEKIEPAELDITVFEIPPAAAYFETIQQLQKISAQLDVLITNQAIILASLRNSDVQTQLNESQQKAAELYEKNLLRYFEKTGIDPDVLRNSIHSDDRVQSPSTGE